MGASVSVKVEVCKKNFYKVYLLLQTFTAGYELGWILRPCWFVNVPMTVLAVVIEGGTGVHWRIVMLKAFIWILRNPEEIDKDEKVIRIHGRNDQLLD